MPAAEHTQPREDRRCDHTCTATQLDHRYYTRHKGHQQASSEEVQTSEQQVNEERKLLLYRGGRRAMRRALMLRQPREGSLLHRRCQCLPSHRCPSRRRRTGPRVSQLQALQSCVVGHTDLQLVSLELDVVWPLKESLLLATQLCGTEPCLPSRANGWHVPKGQTGWRTRRKKAVCVRGVVRCASGGHCKSFRRRRDPTAWCGPHWWQSGEW